MVIGKIPIKLITISMSFKKAVKTRITRENYEVATGENFLF